MVQLIAKQISKTMKLEILLVLYPIQLSLKEVLGALCKLNDNLNCLYIYPKTENMSRDPLDLIINISSLESLEYENRWTDLNQIYT